MGKGFAVVANEVANLSKQSAESVQTSTELIENSLSSVKHGMTQIVCVVNDNSSMAEESAASSEELSDQAAALNEMIGIFRTK